MFLVAEEMSIHTCKTELKRWTETIFVESINDSVKNEDEDLTTIARGLDGVYYAFVLCKHVPSHSIKSRMKQHIREPEDETAPFNGAFI